MALSRDEDVRLNPDDRCCLAHIDLEGLRVLGQQLDDLLPNGDGRTKAMQLAAGELKVRTRERGVGLLEANPVQRLFEGRRGQRNIVLKARQMGLTTWVAGRFFLRTITQPGTLTLQVAHTREAAEEIFCIVHRFYQWLSDDLRQGPLKTLRANVRQLVFPAIDSQYRVESAADRNAGRGLTVQNLHCSELARWPGDPAETLAGLRAALVPEAELILESTPDGASGCFHDEWLRAPETGLVQHFFPWWKEERYRSAAVETAAYTDEERELAAREGLVPEQIGFRRQIRANFGGLARQEYAEDPETCFKMSGECFFEVDALESLLKEAREPMQKRHNGELLIWLEPKAEKLYLVAVDPAGGGIEGDYSAMEVLEMDSGIQCAEFAAHVGGLELARAAAALAEEYNHAWLVVERNNHGWGVLAHLESSCRYERIFADRGKAGWLTDQASRPAALSALGSALCQRRECFPSRNFLAECRSFVRQPNGNPAARAGTHDDRVMAMAIAWAARKELLLGKR